MAGLVEPAAIPDCLAAADVALYPFADTLLNRTKCPAKLTELLLAGRAVVADNVGQLAEYIDPGQSGILCDPDNWQEMAERAVQLLLDPEQSRRLGQSGRQYLRERFSWRDYTAGLNNFYLQLMH
jgi:glycosyltransferase involved in cell wall biosynthesis